MHHLHFNPLAILASAVLQWILGAIWYSPALFAKPWMAMVGIRTETAKKGNMIGGMMMSFIGSLVLSFVLAHVLLWSGATTAGWGAMIGFITWTGFIAAPLSAQYIYEKKHFNLFAINTSYWLVALLMSGALMACWH